MDPDGHEDNANIGPLGHGQTPRWSNPEAAMPNFQMNLQDVRFDLMREEVLASNLMKQLTHKYGTRGKSPKYIFLQAFQEGQKEDAKGLFANISAPRPMSCEAEESTHHGFMDEFEMDEENPYGQPFEMENSALAQILVSGIS